MLFKGMQLARPPSQGLNLGFSDSREFKCLCTHKQLYELLKAAEIKGDGVWVETKNSPTKS